MRFIYKMWFEMGDKAVFGMGLFRLLTLVKQTGSLHKAAKELKMSYRAAWGKVRQAEDKLGVDLLEKGRHGRTGAHLTDKGDFMVVQFEKLLHEMDAFVTKGTLA
ncbi:MAG: LysR family transcriptional regulator, partial [Desulfobacterota bacterium]|nr:LysR family transcriptional regulator [Thermodesulfobacteriota bacterium]